MELRQLIGEILKEELSDISIYIGEARLFAHKLVGGHRIAEVFTAFAHDERDHAAALGRIAGTHADTRPRAIETGPSLRKCLELHLRREALSVALYKKLLSHLTEPGQRMTIKGILSQELDHLRAARYYLMRLMEANGR